MGPYGSIPGRGALALTGVSVSGIAMVGGVALALGVLLVAAAALGIRVGWRRRQQLGPR